MAFTFGSSGGFGGQQQQQNQQQQQPAFGGFGAAGSTGATPGACARSLQGQLGSTSVLGADLSACPPSGLFSMRPWPFACLCSLALPVPGLSRHPPFDGGSSCSLRCFDWRIRAAASAAADISLWCALLPLAAVMGSDRRLRRPDRARWLDWTRLTPPSHVVAFFAPQAQLGDSDPMPLLLLPLALPTQATREAVFSAPSLPARVLEPSAAAQASPSVGCAFAAAQVIYTLT